jgi:hypothetical protein
MKNRFQENGFWVKHFFEKWSFSTFMLKSSTLLVPAAAVIPGAGSRGNSRVEGNVEIVKKVLGKTMLP